MAKIQEVLPLRGKIPNAVRWDFDKLMTNIELSSILTAIGIKVTGKGESCDLSKLRVGKVLLLADSDVDGCFFKNTKIRLLDGATPTFGELIERFPNGGKFWVYSLDEKYQKTLALAHSPRKTKEVTDYCKIELKDGTIIKCTLDHLFSVKNSYGRPVIKEKGILYVRADELLHNDYDNIKTIDLYYYESSKILEPVYDLTVDTYHNFELVGGLFAHNCHISSLILTFLSVYAKELIEQGYVYVVDSPLFVGYYKDKHYYGHTLQEVEKQAKVSVDKMQISRLKGHGEASSDDLRHYAMNPETRKLYKIEMGKGDGELIMKLMGNESDSRKLLLGI